LTARRLLQRISSTRPIRNLIRYIRDFETVDDRFNKIEERFNRVDDRFHDLKVFKVRLFFAMTGLIINCRSSELF
jgi:hypothetical protein